MIPAKFSIERSREASTSPRLESASAAEREGADELDHRRHRRTQAEDPDQRQEQDRLEDAEKRRADELRDHGDRPW